MFLDRDGVLNRAAAPGCYITSPDRLALLDGAGEAVRRLNDAGALTLVITNQRAVALGLMTEADLAAVHAELRRQLAAHGARLDGIFHCPHALDSCDCRKPGVGMFLAAQREHPEILFTTAVMVGDSESDMLAARRIGARGVLIAPGAPGRFRASSLLEAVEGLLGADQPGTGERCRAAARPSGVPTSMTGPDSR